MIIVRTIGARLGLLGNPSDGFGGKTLSTLIGDYYATVWLWESPVLELQPHPLFDQTRFGSLADLDAIADREGYYGGLRLVMATCRRFFLYCRQHGIELPDRNFTLAYHTSIPRQVGLGGSSAIVCGCLKALMQFYELTDEQIPMPVQPNLVLEAEREELGIQAGLQDRVVQVYGGLIYMDFSPELMEKQGYGYYEPLPVDLLPPLYLAYAPGGKDSGRLHTPMRVRWERGDPEVHEVMARLAEIAEEGRQVLLQGNMERLGQLMNENFDLRRALYGEEGLGRESLEMIGIARAMGLPAKFPGSGGAICGLLPDPEIVPEARKRFQSRGYVFHQVTPVTRVRPSAESLKASLQRVRAMRQCLPSEDWPRDG
ncbi:MAG: hypothetical protein J7M26_10335 [Armatimonadetes bacterium]|nr:hypothetical protein [Armatimonadota bacterium]